MKARPFAGISFSIPPTRMPVAGMLLITCLLLPGYLSAQKVFEDNRRYHLRYGKEPQWGDFGTAPYGTHLDLVIPVSEPDENFSLLIRHYGVMLDWLVLLNDSIVGKLEVDEKDMISCYDIPAGILVPGNNTLRIATIAKAHGSNLGNDIRVGEIKLEKGKLSDLLKESVLNLELRDEATKQLMPGKFTIVNAEGVCVPLGAGPQPGLAVRTGYVYTVDGRAAVSLRAGSYMVYATRGFEYGVDSAKVVTRKDQAVSARFQIRREVQTPGLVSSDTHIHTFSYSGHGDASTKERLITIAGEQIEMPVITDHNVYADLRTEMPGDSLKKHFTLVNGMELTTKVGHFNIFPLDYRMPVPEYRVSTWKEVADNTAADKNIKVRVFNHPRDLHSGFRPFDPSLHIASAGWHINGWEIPGNAMELINSGALQSDMLRPVYDWFGLINGENAVTGVGASDSHTVSRYLLGQARTYIDADDRDPGNLQTGHILSNFVSGKTMVSFGLLAEIAVNENAKAGDTIHVATPSMSVTVRVSGPSWTKADSVTLYANGIKIREAAISDPGRPGTKWEYTWQIPTPPHDVFLVAVASGPGEKKQPYWQIPRPYQPSVSEWTPKVMGISGAVYIATTPGKAWQSANQYALTLVKNADGDLKKLYSEMKSFDESVGIQVARHLYIKGRSVDELMQSPEFLSSSSNVRAGFRKFATELRKTGRKAP
ncbi:MAG: hypothetical protein ABS46_07970 [Cytophagaceae bacterium SCN 52-12]|nr:MAG: hypothetical protein ABS46_07970 [Cytophagaceae bacterium SCN 52-12]